MKINQAGYHLLNTLLFAAIVLGSYEVLEVKSLVAIFIVPAFIISASLRIWGKKDKTED